MIFPEWHYTCAAKYEANLQSHLQKLLERVKAGTGLWEPREGNRPGATWPGTFSRLGFIINKAAKQIGLTIPVEVLARADKVIK